MALLGERWRSQIGKQGGDSKRMEEMLQMPLRLDRNARPMIK